jgi:hypothetical protein
MCYYSTMSIQGCSDNEMIFICLGTLSIFILFFGNVKIREVSQISTFRMPLHSNTILWIKKKRVWGPTFGSLRIDVRRYVLNIADIKT